MTLWKELEVAARDPGSCTHTIVWAALGRIWELSEEENEVFADGLKENIVNLAAAVTDDPNAPASARTKAMDYDETMVTAERINALFSHPTTPQEVLLEVVGWAPMKHDDSFMVKSALEAEGRKLRPGSLLAQAIDVTLELFQS